MSPILVTGANGFIGSHLVADLKNYHKVISLIHDLKPGRWLQEALEGTTVVQGDVRNFRLLTRIINQYDVDSIYHLAARANVKQAYRDPLNVYDINVMGTVALLEASRQQEVEKICILLTDKCFGEKMNAIVDSPLQPSEPYATSKICQRLIAESYTKTYEMNIVIPHACNIFGLDLYSNRIFPNTIKKAIRGESPLIFTNDYSIREYIYIEDLIRALRLLMEGRYHGPYNIATGWVYNQREIVLKILEHFPDLEPKYVEAKLPPQIQRQTLKITRWTWEPWWTFDKAVEETIERYRQYREDWR